MRLTLLVLLSCCSITSAQDHERRRTVVDPLSQPITVNFKGADREIWAPEGTYFLDHLVSADGQSLFVVSAEKETRAGLQRLLMFEIGRYLADTDYTPSEIKIRTDLERFTISSLCGVSDDGNRLLLILHRAAWKTAKGTRYKSFPYRLDLKAGTLSAVDP